VHPYAVTPSKLAPDMGTQGADINLRPLNTCIIGIYKVFDSLVCCLKEYGCTLIPLHQPQVGPRFGDSGSLVE
jgi:hypothetical protein